MKTDKLVEVISSILEISPEIVDDNLSIETCDNWDSMNHMSLILALEEVFDLKIDDETAIDLISFKDVKNYISSRAK